jgi:hypothetical protein
MPRFYILPKIHKDVVSSRPIVPNYDWLTTETSIWLHNKLWPYVEQIDWIAKNSLEVIHYLDQGWANYGPRAGSGLNEVFIRPADGFFKKLLYKKLNFCIFFNTKISSSTYKK